MKNIFHSHTIHPHGVLVYASVWFLKFWGKILQPVEKEKKVEKIPSCHIRRKK